MVTATAGGLSDSQKRHRDYRHRNHRKDGYVEEEATIDGGETVTTVNPDPKENKEGLSPLKEEQEDQVKKDEDDTSNN